MLARKTIDEVRWRDRSGSRICEQLLSAASPRPIRRSPAPSPRARPPARRDRADRLGEHRQPRGARGAGLGADQQIRRGLSGQALLRRLPVRRHRRDAGDRAGHQAVRLPLRQRAAALRRQANQAAFMALMQPGDTFMGLNLAGRRPPDPRLAGQHVGQVVQGRAYGVRRDDHRIDMDEVEQLAREHKPKVIVAGGSAYPRIIDFRALPRDRRRGRRLSDGRHGAFRRPGRRRRASLARSRTPMWSPRRRTRPCAARAAADPHQRRGDRQEDQLGGVPRPAGRAADARHRRQGGGLRRGAAARVQALRQERRRERQGAGRNAEVGAASISSPAAPTTT